MPARRRASISTGYLLSHHKYSLEFRQDHKYLDPIASFLLSTPEEDGHCEFFATAACVLLRGVGVPTRYVTGYYVHEGAGGTTMIVRQRDAHAWCQAWIDGTGWITVDATPGDGRPDALENDTPVEPWRRVWERIQDALQAITFQLANITPVQTGAVVVGFSVLSAGGWAFWMYWKRRALLARLVSVPKPTYTMNDVVLRAQSERFEQAWKRATGTALPANRSYSEYLRLRGADAEAPLPDGLAAASAEFAREYEAARFGSPIDDERREALRRLLEKIETIEPVAPGAAAEKTSMRESTTTR